MDPLKNLLDIVSSRLADYPLIATLIGVILLAIVALIADFIAKRQLVRLLRGLAKRTRSTWDDALIGQRVFSRFAKIVPAVIVMFGAKWIPGLSDGILQVIENVALAYMALMIMLALGALMNAANSIYEQYPVAKDQPIKGYLQVAKIVLYIVGAILVISALLGRSPLLLLSGFGALTAVLMLVFRDTILSLVASIQLIGNDMVRVGDWIEMPESNADGDVIDVALHTIKVQNWDKTITTIPTYKLISESFRNWRGMSESGGRRIKRSLLLDQNSIRFLTDDETAKFKRFALLKDYIETKQQELSVVNAALDNTEGANVNLRRLTNIGTFRAYVVNYLSNRTDISESMTFLVRQLPPGANGLPIEIYIFSNTTEWVAYENIQADIFDHLLAIIPEFGLRVYQKPSGMDVRALEGSPGLGT
ncbi:MAG: mechanosensitive ion channel family protein [Gammaproteobacteria bacterium]|nr:mechanosensitive ion channel family protein [Gammaproteobacteria bacterium]